MMGSRSSLPHTIHLEKVCHCYLHRQLKLRSKYLCLTVTLLGQWLLCGCCVCQWLLPKGRCFCSLLQSINYGRQAG